MFLLPATLIFHIDSEKDVNPARMIIEGDGEQ